MNNKKKVGILTLPLNANYGGTLQAYALLTFLKCYGCDTYYINRRWNNNRNDISYKVQKWFYKNVMAYNFTKFIKKNLMPSTAPITSFKQMEQINTMEFDAVIVGSDQVWRIENTIGVGNNYFLDFITNNNIKRISYAASFGTDKIMCSDSRKNEIGELLKKFDAISVREESGVDICNSEFGIFAEQLIDPTLLLDKTDYLKLIDCSKTKKINKRLTTYILDNSSEKVEIINKVAEYKGLIPFAINSNLKSLSYKSLLLNLNKIIFPSISQWIDGINEADFVITDSFHGTVFSIIFNKPFISIGNYERGFTRFTSLLKIFNLEERLIVSSKEITEYLISSEIDFENINIILDKKRKESIEFFKRNL